MDSRSTIITNYSLAKKLAINGIKNYFDDKSSFFEGFLQGNLGKIRAKKILHYLSNTSKNEEFIACMLALFGELDTDFFPFKYHRSSQLAGLIAEQWIQGKHIYTSTNIPIQLSSNIIDQSTIQTIISNSSVKTIRPNHYGYSIFIDKKQAVRRLLRETLTSEFTELEQKNIFYITTFLEKNKFESISSWISAVTVGTLLNVNYVEPVQLESKSTKTKSQMLSPQTSMTDSTPLPLELAEKIGTYLTIADGFSLLRVRKKAKESVDSFIQENNTMFKLTR
jgi:hypothetical protein